MKDKRISITHHYMKMAMLVSERSTCLHRHQGVVLVKDNHVLSTGYNGSAPGQPHCIDVGCAKDAANGDIRACRAEGLHGESNAIAFAARLGISTIGATAFCLYSPCKACCNLLKSAGITDVVYHEVYSGFPEGPEYLRELDIGAMKV